MNKETSDSRVTAAKPRQSGPKWHRVYYLLAAFDVLIVLLSLFLNYQIVSIYNHSVKVNQEWTDLRNETDQLGMLAGQVNAPGNDVFDSHDVDVQSVKMRAALDIFNRHMAVVNQDLRNQLAKKDTHGVIVETDEAELRDDLAAVQSSMSQMTDEAEVIFSYFQQDRAELAGRRMATMDQKYGRVHASLAKLREDISGIQERLSQQESASAASLRKFDYLIAIFVFLMVGAATVYGHKIKKQMEAADGEKYRALDLLTTKVEERKQAEEQLQRQLDFTETITASLGEGLYGSI